MKGQKWTPEMDARLRELHGGGLSMAEIAERIGGVSRNSVIGRANRLGLARATKSSTTRRARKQAAAILPERIAATLTVGAAVTGALAATASLQSTQCRWPIGDPGDPGFRYCCALKPLGQPYCELHRRKARAALQPLPPGKRRSAA